VWFVRNYFCPITFYSITLSPKNKISRIFSIDWDKLHNAHQSRWVVVDLFMLVLVFVNLLYIGFDWSFTFLWVQKFWQNIWPSFFEWYAGSVHPNFYQIDLLFVLIFITEVVIRWGISIYKKAYDRWYFYPFIHWYDVLSCIPLNGTFRLLRLLRLFSLFYRLQRVGAIDITRTYFYGKFTKILNIIVEEISDRVVVNVLTGTQEELKSGHPVTDKIIQDVLLPRQEILVDWLSEQVRNAVALSYDTHRNELKEYIDSIVTRSIKQNKEIRTLEMIPGLGKSISATLDNAIGDIVFNVVDNLMNDLAGAENKKGIREFSHTVFESLLEHPDESRELNDLVTGIVNDSIEVVKQGVLVKQWKIRSKEEQEKVLHTRIEKELEKTFGDLPAAS